MSNFTDFELTQIAKEAAQRINDRIDEMVKAIGFGGPVPLSPIEEERRRSMRSTFEGGNNPDPSARYGWTLPALFAKISNLLESGDARKIASAHILTKTYDRLSTGCKYCDMKIGHEDDCTNLAHRDGIVGI